MLTAILCIIAFSTLVASSDNQEPNIVSDGSVLYFVAEPDFMGRALRSSMDEGKPRFSRFGERGHFPYYKGLGRK